jgi:hypothetical protein
VSLTTNLIAYYKADEASGNLLDAHSVGPYPLTANNGPGTRAGKINGGRDLVYASSQWFEHADHVDFSVGDIDFTIAGWFLSDDGTRSASFVDKSASNDLPYDLGYTSAQFRFRVSSAAGFANLTTIVASNFGTVPLSTWCFVVAWHDATANTINICVNDGTVNSTAYSAGSYDDGGKFFIGSNAFGEHVDGGVDEVGFWKRKLTGAEITQLYNAGAGLAYPFSTGSFTASPTDVPKGHAGNITLTLAGTGTSWAGGGSQFSVSGVTGAAKVSESVTSATAATLVITTGTGTGTLTISDGTNSTTVTVSAATLGISPTAGNLNSIQTLAVTGTHTLWASETAAGLFSVSGGTGASIGTPTVTTDTAATVALTVGTGAGTLTVTDTSTGATATFAAGGGTVVILIEDD